MYPTKTRSTMPVPVDGCKKITCTEVVALFPIKGKNSFFHLTSSVKLV